MAKFLADNTLFVAGIKALPERETNSLKLLLKLLSREDADLIADDILVKEYEKYAEKLGGGMTRALIQALLSKTELVEPDNQSIETVKPHFDEKTDPEDIIHTAAALQEEATIITNDPDFDPIGEESIVEVWNHTKAMEELGII